MRTQIEIRRCGRLALLALGLGACQGAAAQQAVPAATAPADAAAGQDDRASLREQAALLRREQLAAASSLVEKYPNDFDAQRVMGFVHSSQGQLEAMARCWQRCRQIDSARADIHDQLGRYFAQVERFDEAIDAWQQALTIDPKLSGIYQQIGAAQLSLGEPNQAATSLRAELRRTPQSIEALYLLGEALFQTQDFAQAKQCYLRAIQLEPQHKNAYYGLVKVCTRLGETEAATRYAQQFQQLEQLAIAADAEVRRNYDDLRQVRESVVVTYIEAGQVYHRHQDASLAEPLWARAAVLDPQNVECRNLLVASYVKHGKIERAAATLEELVRLQPVNVDFHQQLGFLWARLGKLDAAEASLRKTIEIAPRRASGYRALAKFYLNTNRQPARARELARRAVQLEPIADSFFVLGWAQAKMGESGAAEQALREAIRLDPDNATYRKLYAALRGQ